jgi:RNA polymerase sigma factor FliA
MVSVENIGRRWQEFKVHHNLAAREELILHYGFLVRSTANRLLTRTPAGMERDDVLAIGTHGLIRSIDTFDPTREIRFEAYAVQIIRLAILDYLRDHDPLPRTVREKLKLTRNARNQMEVELGRPPTIDEIAGRLNMAVADVGMLQSHLRYADPVSLDDPLGDGESFSRSDFVVDVSVNPERDLLSEELRNQLALAIHRLPTRERRIIALYYHEGLTFRELGEVLGVSETRVHQLHGQAVTRIRKSIERFGTPIRN